MRLKFNRTKPEAKPPLTIEEQHQASATLAAAALSVFDDVAKDLEEAGAQAADVAFLAGEEIEHLSFIRLGAEEDAERYVAQARRIRDLVDA